MLFLSPDTRRHVVFVSRHPTSCCFCLQTPDVMLFLSPDTRRHVVFVSRHPTSCCFCLQTPDVMLFLSPDTRRHVVFVSRHPTSCCSIAEVMSVLFFHTMRYKVKEPRDPANDRFVLSKVCTGLLLHVQGYYFTYRATTSGISLQLHFPLVTMLTFCTIIRKRDHKKFLNFLPAVVIISLTCWSSFVKITYF